MNNKNLSDYKFFTFDQLIAKIQQEGLLITNKSKLRWYLKAYNYQNVINEYNQPFLLNHQHHVYLKNANSQMILDLFNFNRCLSTLLIGDLHSIEMELSSSIAYELMQIINKLHPNQASLSALSNEEKATIFRNGSEKEIKEITGVLQTSFEKMRKNKEYLNKGWNKWEEVPLYYLALFCTFGNAISLFCCLNQHIQKQILSSYFHHIANIDLKTFECLLFCFKDLRNKISHNEVIYKFKLEATNLINRIIQFNPSSRKNKVEKILKQDFLTLLQGNENFGINLKLIAIIKIIIKITDNYQLKNLINKKLTSLKSSINTGCHVAINKFTQYASCNQAWKNICSYLGLDDQE